MHRYTAETISEEISYCHEIYSGYLHDHIYSPLGVFQTETEGSPTLLGHSYVFCVHPPPVAAGHGPVPEGADVRLVFHAGLMKI